MIHRRLRSIGRYVLGPIRPRWRRTDSQEGEDIVLSTFFEHHPPGIYCDIGAHDPVVWSNTRKLARQGWWGINIDPRPGLSRKFARLRPRDICMEVAIDLGSREPLFYWMFDVEPRWNCLSPTEPSVKRNGETIRPTSHREVPVVTIGDALSRAKLDHVDLVNIDIEGGEDYILRHWPWDRYTPKAVCVEIIGQPAAEIANSDLTRFLTAKGMVFASQLVCSVIYLEREFLATRYPTDPEATHFGRACARSG